MEKITRARLFGFTHRPDVSIGNDGSAIEIKVVTNGSSMRDVLGQSMAYRMHYRFVIMIIVDQTADCKIVTLCRDKGSQEHALLRGLADEMNIFTIVGPLGQSKNVVFGPRPVPAAKAVGSNLPKPSVGDASEGR